MGERERLVWSLNMRVPHGTSCFTLKRFAGPYDRGYPVRPERRAHLPTIGRRDRRANRARRVRGRQQAAAAARHRAHSRHQFDHGHARLRDASAARSGGKSVWEGLGHYVAGWPIRASSRLPQKSPGSSICRSIGRPPKPISPLSLLCCRSWRKIGVTLHCRISMRPRGQPGPARLPPRGWRLLPGVVIRPVSSLPTVRSTGSPASSAAWRVPRKSFWPMR